MSRFIALILIPFNLIMQPVPHVHAAGSAQEQKEQAPHVHVHLSAIWGGHSHHEHEHEHVSSRTPDEDPHDSDAIYIGELTALIQTGVSLKLVTSTWQLGFGANRANSLSAKTGEFSTSSSLDLAHVLGTFSDVPLFLQGGSFRI